MISLPSLDEALVLLKKIDSTNRDSRGMLSTTKRGGKWFANLSRRKRTLFSLEELKAIVIVFDSFDDTDLPWATSDEYGLLNERDWGEE